MKTLIPTLLLLMAASAHGTELNPDMVGFPREANAAFTTGTKEAQRCAAFWAIAAHCFAQTEDSRAPALAKRLSDEFDATTMYAASMAKKLGMDEQKFQEYSKTVTHELMQETNNNCDNLGVLRTHYFDLCTALHHDPNARMNQLFICYRTRPQSCPYSQ